MKQTIHLQVLATIGSKTGGATGRNTKFACIWKFT